MLEGDDTATQHSLWKLSLGREVEAIGFSTSVFSLSKDKKLASSSLMWLL